MIDTKINSMTRVQVFAFLLALAYLLTLLGCVGGVILLTGLGLI